MKSLMFCLTLVLISGSVFAAEDPSTFFGTESNKVKVGRIKWIPVDDAHATCQRQSKKYGLSGFTEKSLEACSFWKVMGEETYCTIYTNKNLSMDTLAHEIRHCFQGQWH